MSRHLQLCPHSKKTLAAHHPNPHQPSSTLSDFQFSITPKILLLTYKHLYACTPHYLSDLLTPCPRILSRCPSHHPSHHSHHNEKDFQTHSKMSCTCNPGHVYIFCLQFHLKAPLFLSDGECTVGPLSLWTHCDIHMHIWTYSLQQPEWLWSALLFFSKFGTISHFFECHTNWADPLIWCCSEQGKCYWNVTANAWGQSS